MNQQGQPSTVRPTPSLTTPKMPSVPSPEPKDIPVEPPKKKGLLKNILIILLVIILGAGLFYAGYIYGQKKTLIPQTSSPTPTPDLTATPTSTTEATITPTPASDSTLNWKVFEYPNLKFRIKLPTGWSERGGSVEQPYLYDAEKQVKIFVAIGEKSFWEESNEKSTIDIFTFDLADSNHKNYFEENLNTASSIETIQLDGKAFKRYSNVVVEIGPGSTKNFTYWTLEENGLGAKFMIGDRLAGSELNEDLVRQILATFNFL